MRYTRRQKIKIRWRSFMYRAYVTLYHRELIQPTRAERLAFAEWLDNV